MSDARLCSIQILRAVAAALVVLNHCHFHPATRGYISESMTFSNFGNAGVALFFVISGFIMFVVGSKSFQTEGASKNFIIRRFIRIAPIYWFYTAVTALLLVSFPQLSNSGKSFDLGNFFASLFFVPWGSSANPVLSIGWTLNFEMYFYVIFAILLLFPARMFFPLLALWLTSLVVLGNVFWTDNVLLSVARSSLVMNFLIGSAIGALYLRGSQLTRRMAGLLLMAGIVSLLVDFAGRWHMVGHLMNQSPHLAKVIKWGIPAGLVIAGAVHLERAGAFPISSFLVKLGDSSYSLYLTHIFTINGLLVVWVWLFNDYYSLFIITSFACSILVGHVAFLLIEKPITDFLRSHYRPDRIWINLKQTTPSPLAH